MVDEREDTEPIWADTAFTLSESSVLVGSICTGVSFNATPFRFPCLRRRLPASLFQKKNASKMRVKPDTAPTTIPPIAPPERPAVVPAPAVMPAPATPAVTDVMKCPDVAEKETDEEVVGDGTRVDNEMGLGGEREAPDETGLGGEREAADEKRLGGRTATGQSVTHDRTVSLW